MRTFIILLALASVAAQAQVPKIVSIPLAIESPDLREGAFEVTIRWYDDAALGSLHGVETTSIVINHGHTTIVLGNASPLPADLLERGRAWISVQFSGYAEPELRYPVYPHAFSQTAAYALVAASLDPRATGLVTSINELAGAVELVGGRGVTITRAGRTIAIESGSHTEQGVINGDGITSEFTVRLSDTTLLGEVLTSSVSGSPDLIVTSSEFDPINRFYRIITSAILTPRETLRWHVGHR